MTYVIGQPCIDIAPAWTTPSRLHLRGRTDALHPDERVDCGACEPVSGRVHPAAGPEQDRWSAGAGGFAEYLLDAPGVHERVEVEADRVRVHCQFVGQA